MIFRRAILAVLMLLPLAACSSNGTPSVGTSDSNHIAYEKYGITRMHVNDIQIVDTYQPPLHAPNVEHELYTPPYIALRDWARNRFEATGTMGTAKIEILDASIIQNDLAVKNDFDWFNDTHIETNFRMRLAVRIEINSPNYIDLPYAEAVVVRKFHFDTKVNAADHMQMFEDSLPGALDQLDGLMTQTLREKWGSIIQ